MGRWVLLARVILPAVKRIGVLQRWTLRGFDPPERRICRQKIPSHGGTIVA